MYGSIKLTRPTTSGGVTPIGIFSWQKPAAKHSPARPAAASHPKGRGCSASDPKPITSEPRSAWAMEHDVNRGVDLIITLTRLWEMDGQSPELLRWCERAFATPTVMNPDTRAWGLRIYGWLLGLFGQHERAQKVLPEALSCFRRTGDLAGEADALMGLAQVQFAQRAPEKAIAFNQQAVDILRRVGDGTGAAAALNNLGSALIEARHYAEAETALEEAVTLAASSDNRYILTPR